MPRWAPVAFAVAAAALAWAAPATSQEADCDELLRNAERLFSEGQFNVLFWDDSLSILSAFHAPEYTCPWRTEERHKPYCTKPLEPSLYTPAPTLPPTVGDADVNGVDFGLTLMQAVLNETNYAACRDIFEGDARLQEALTDVPPPTDAQMLEFRRLAETSREYGPSPGGPRSYSSGIRFSETQKKLLSVYGALDSWAYCASDKIGAIPGGSGRTLGQYFDRPSRRITLYNGVCASRDLHGLEISFVPSFFSAYLIAAHEFGHAIHDVSGGPSLAMMQSEALATHYGSLFAECAASQADKQLARLEGALFTDAGVEAVPPGSLDREYMLCAVDRMSGWAEFFRRARSEIDLKTGAVPATLRAMNEENASPRGSSYRESAISTRTAGLRAVDMAMPDFDLPDLQNRRHRLADYRGNFVLMKIWSSARLCGYLCQSEIAATQALSATLKKSGVRTVAVIIGDGAGAREFLGESNADFPILLDTDSTFSIALGVRGLPMSLVLDREGRIVLMGIGAMRGDDNDKVLAQVLEIAAPPN